MSARIDVTLIDVKRNFVLYDIVDIDGDGNESLITGGRFTLPEGSVVPVPKILKKAIARKAKLVMQDRRANATVRRARDQDSISKADTIITQIDGLIKV